MKYLILSLFLVACESPKPPAPIDWKAHVATCNIIYEWKAAKIIEDSRAQESAEAKRFKECEDAMKSATSKQLKFMSCPHPGPSYAEKLVDLQVFLERCKTIHVTWGNL